MHEFMDYTCVFPLGQACANLSSFSVWHLVSALWVSTTSGCVLSIILDNFMSGFSAIVYQLLWLVPLVQKLFCQSEAILADTLPSPTTCQTRLFVMKVIC